MRPFLFECFSFHCNTIPLCAISRVELNVMTQKIEKQKRPAVTRAETVYNGGNYSASRISIILIADVAIGVPGPNIAAAPSR